MFGRAFAVKCVVLKDCIQMDMKNMSEMVRAIVHDCAKEHNFDANDTYNRLYNDLFIDLNVDMQTNATMNTDADADAADGDINVETMFSDVSDVIKSDDDESKDKDVELFELFEKNMIIAREKAREWRKRYVANALKSVDNEIDKLCLVSENVVDDEVVDDDEVVLEKEPYNMYESCINEMKTLNNKKEAESAKENKKIEKEKKEAAKENKKIEKEKKEAAKEIKKIEKEKKEAVKKGKKLEKDRNAAAKEAVKEVKKLEKEKKESIDS